MSGQPGLSLCALEHHRHISRIAFREFTSRVLGRFTAIMHEPFPALTDLHLQSVDETRCVIPDAFLGRSAPQLQIFLLDGIAFPALPGLLASAIHLTKLRLEKIPDSGYIPPDVMVTCLSVFLKLDELAIIFQSPRRPSPSQTPPPLSHAVLPALTYFRFGGDSRYLEDLMSRIRAPNLDYLNIWFFMITVVAVPQLCNFISDAEGLRQLKRACIVLDPWSVRLSLGPPTSLDLVRCDRLDQRVSWMVKLCDALSHLLCNVRCLEIQRCRFSV
jgi:hypothetical protein